MTFTVENTGVFFSDLTCGTNRSCSLNSTMQRDYDVQIAEDPHSPRFLEYGCIKCIVTQTVHPFKTRHFIYCLHCLKLRSSSWFFDHRKRIEFDLSSTSIQKYRSRFFTLSTIFTLKSITSLKREPCSMSVAVQEAADRQEPPL